MDEQDDVGSGVGSSTADVVESAGDAQGDDAAGVDAIVSYPGVGVSTACGQCLGQGVVAGCGCGSARQGSVGPSVIVVLDELVEERLQFGRVVGLSGLGSEPFLHRLLESLHFALGGGVAWSAVLLDDVESAELVLQGVSAGATGEAGREDHAVVVSVEAGIPALWTAARNSSRMMIAVTAWWAVTRMA